MRALLALLVVAAFACSSDGRSEVAGPSSTDPVAETVGVTTKPSPTTQPLLTTSTRPTSVVGMVEAWRVPLAEPVSSRPNRGGRIVFNGPTVLVALDRSLVAYDAASGAPLWTLPLAIRDVEPLLPLIVDSTVVVPTDTQTLERVDLRTGRRQWQARVGGAAAICTAMTSPVANKLHLLVVSQDRCNETKPEPARLVAISLAQGTVVWERLIAGTEQGGVHTSPGVNDNVVVVGANGDRRISGKDTYSAFEAGTGAPRWTAEFDRPPVNIALGIAQAPRLYENAVVVVQVATVLTDIARPAGLDVATGRTLWFSSIGNEVLIGDTLVGLDRVRDSPQQPLAAIGIDVLTGQTRWRDSELRSYSPLDASSSAAFVSDRFVVVDPRSGTRRIDVPLTDLSADGPLFRRGFVLDDAKAVVLTTTPQTNVTVANMSIQLRDLNSGSALAAFNEPAFATAYQLGGDLVVAVLARGPNEQSVIVAYRIIRE